jgi:hypothetical protein
MNEAVIAIQFMLELANKLSAAASVVAAMQAEGRTKMNPEEKAALKAANASARADLVDALND